MLTDLFQVLGLITGVLSVAALGLLIVAGIALALVKGNEDGEL